MDRTVEDILNDLAFLFPQCIPVFKQILLKHNKALDNENHHLKQEIASIKIELANIIKEVNTLKLNL